MPVYRVVSYILLGIAGILSLFDLIGLLVSLANPAGFLGVFILTGVIIYTATSFYFSREGVQKGRVLKKSLRDWIRVNAFVAIFFGVMSIADCITFLAQPKMVDDVYKEMIRMQPAYAKAGVTKESLAHLLNGVIIFLVIYCVLLLAHIVVTFALLKKNRQVFGNISTNQPN